MSVSCQDRLWVPVPGPLLPLMGLQHDCCYGWLLGKRVPRDASPDSSKVLFCQTSCHICNPSRLTSESPAACRDDSQHITAVMRKNTLRHWVPGPRYCSRRASDTEL